MKQSGFFPAIAAAAFFSLLVFGCGAFLHLPALAPVSPAASATGKSVPSAHHGKKQAAKAAAPQAVVGQTTENRLAFPLMLAGAGGLLLSALAGLGLCRSITQSQPLAARRMQAAELAARQKQQEEFEAQRSALQSQLSEAKLRKAETETLRDQVSRQFQEFFRTLPVPCFCFAANGRIIRWNAACEALYGIAAAAALDSTLWETIVPDSEREEAEAKLNRVLTGESLFSVERWDMTSGGTLTRLRCSMVPLYDAEGVIIGGLSAGVDATELAQQEQQIAELTTALEAARRSAASAASEAADEETIAVSLSIGSTELSGHPSFRARLAEEIERAARYHSTLSLILLDMDGFAAWNKAFGYDAGDEALQSAVAVIKSKIRSVDVVARLGADEYAVILPETGEAGARVAAERLRTGLAGNSSGNRPPLTACFGVAQLGPDVSGAETLVSHALEALENARSCGANTVVHFQDLPDSTLTNVSHQTVSAGKTRK